MLPLPSHPPNLDYNGKGGVLGPLSAHAGHQISTQPPSAAKPVGRINTPLDGPSHSNQHDDSTFSHLPSAEPPQSCSGSFAASYSPSPSWKGGLDRNAGGEPHGLPTYGGPPVLGGAERCYYDSEKQSLSTSDSREPTSRARPAAATSHQGAPIDEDSNPEDHALWILVSPSSHALSDSSSLTYPICRSIFLSSHPSSPS